eukprot:1152903-Pelagomonas_calceolata.AAC.2
MEVSALQRQEKKEREKIAKSLTQLRSCQCKKKAIVQRERLSLIRRAALKSTVQGASGHTSPPERCITGEYPSRYFSPMCSSTSRKHPSKYFSPMWQHIMGSSQQSLSPMWQHITGTSQQIF